MRRTVAFQFTAAYRRDYEWGKFFREQWRTDLPGSAWRDGGSCFTPDSCYLQGTGDPADVQTFDYLGAGTEDRYFGFQIKLAVGRNYFKLE
eukprot:9223742-Pyramimonas_sp.AAC.1